MEKALELFLGVLTAMGGFVEVGELTFALNGGSHFGYKLLWIAILGTIGIMVYAEMAGRVAAVRHQPVFNLIRERVGFTAGLVTLLAANLVNLMTCAAEIGGIALIWQLLSGWPYRALVALAFVFLVVTVWVLPFRWIERVFGLGGLLLIVFIAAAVAQKPDWHEMAQGALPGWPHAADDDELRLFAYYAVALFSSILLPYEVYFYAAGGIEDRWTVKDIGINRVIVIVGFALGALLSVALLALGAEFLRPRAIEPQSPGIAALIVATQYGAIALVLALLGMFFAFSGAAIETALSGAYNLAHFFGWPWGKLHKPRKAPRFALAWLAMFALAAGIIVTGIDPIQVVEYSIVLSVIILPFTYFPLLVIAGDKHVMGAHRNGRVINALGWFYLALVSIAALCAIPLLVITHGGRG